MTDPLHVTSETGWITATSTTITALLGGGSLFAALSVWIKTRNPLRKMNIDAETRMREELNERLHESEGRRETEKVHMENEIRILRHRLNNVQHAFDMMLALLEANPEKVIETLEKIKRIRADQLAAEASEKGHVMAAREARATK